MKLGLVIGIWCTLAAPAALAEEATGTADPGNTIADQIDLDETEEYVEMVECISLRRIRRTKSVRNEAMLFYMRGGTVYLNQFQSACPRMGPPLVPSFVTNFGDRFCRHDRIDVLDSVMGVVGWCSVGAFEEVSEEQAELILSETTKSGREVMDAIEAEDE